MNKIIAGFLGLVMVSAVVGGTAYALFSSTATVSGVTFATGNADLQVWNGSTWTKDWSPSTLIFTNMYPNYQTSAVFYLKNTSTAAIALNITGQLRNGVTETPANSWNTLKDVVYVRVTTSEGTTGDTGWISLSNWNASSQSLPGGSLAQNIQRAYTFMVYVNSSSGNEIAGYGISDVHFDFVGTQAL